MNGANNREREFREQEEIFVQGRTTNNLGFRAVAFQLLLEHIGRDTVRKSAVQKRGQGQKFGGQKREWWVEAILKKLARAQAFQLYPNTMFCKQEPSMGHDITLKSLKMKPNRKKKQCITHSKLKYSFKYVFLCTRLQCKKFSTKKRETE